MNVAYVVFALVIFFNSFVAQTDSLRFYEYMSTEMTGNVPSYDAGGDVSLAMAMFDGIGSSEETGGKNYMFSPLSIKMAFMVAANGAEGETQEEILRAFNIEDLNAYNKAAGEIIAKTQNNKTFELNIANSIWFNTDFYDSADLRFSDGYKTAVGDHYNAEAREVDNDTAVKTINGWISDKTKGKIKDVLSNPEFLAALVNTVYFKADWVSEFDNHDTYESDFTDKNGDAGRTDFMRQTDEFQYYENGKLQMLHMPYKNSSVGMYVFLPKDGAVLTAGDIQTALDTDMESMEEVFVKIPKFKTEFSVTMNDIMIELGVSTAFSKTCVDFNDVMFTGVPDGYYIFISKVLHKTFIEVDEKGTEAAAATAILMDMAMAMPPDDGPEPKQFIADHPFMYMIRENSSGEILFFGHYSYVE